MSSTRTGIMLAFAGLALCLAPSTTQAQTAHDLAIEYLPAGMVDPGSGSGGTADWIASVGPTDADLVNLPSFDAMTVYGAGSEPLPGITSSFTITGGEFNNGRQLRGPGGGGNGDTWPEVLVGPNTVEKNSATMEFWLKTSNLDQDRRVIYETGGSTGFAVIQDDGYLGAQISVGGKEYVYVDLGDVPYLGDLTGEWFQTAVVIDQDNKKLSLHINGLHVGDSNAGGAAGVINGGGSNFNDWDGGDPQALFDAGGPGQVSPNQNLGGFGNGFTHDGPSPDNGDGAFTAWDGEVGAVRLYASNVDNAAALTLSEIGVNYESLAGETYNDWDFERGAADGNWRTDGSAAAIQWDNGGATASGQFARIIGNGDDTTDGDDVVTLDTAETVGTLGVGTSSNNSAGTTILQIETGADLTVEGHLIVGLDGTSNYANQVVQNDGAVSVGGNLTYGLFGDEGGEYFLNGGTLDVAGSIIEAYEGVDGAQFHVDGGTLNVGGDITVQSFRTGNAPGSNGDYTLPGGKTLTNTGTFYVGYEGTGQFTNNGGQIDVSNRFEVADSGWVDDQGDADPANDVTVGSVGTYIQNAGTVNVLDGGVQVASGTNTVGTFEVRDGAFNVADDGILMAQGTGSTATAVIGQPGGGGNPTIYLGDDNLEIAVNGTGSWTQHSGTVLQDGASGGNDNVVVVQNAGSAGTLNLYGGVIDLRGAAGDATDGSLNFNKGIGTATLSGPTARFYTSQDVNLADTRGGQGVVTVDDGAELHIRRNIEYRTGGITDTVSLQGGLINFYDPAGGAINQTDPDDQFNWTGGRLQNLATFNGIGDKPYVLDTHGVAGELAPASPALVAGKVGAGALDFANTGPENNHVNFGDADLGDGQGKFSVSLWFNRRTDRAGDATNHDIDNVLIAQSSNQNDNFEIGTEGDYVEFYLDTGPDATSRAAVAGGIANDTWYHLAFTYDDDLGTEADDSAKVYLDGQLVGSFSGYDDVLAGSGHSPWSLGVSRPGWDNWGDFDGLIDEVAAWEGYALTEADILSLYNGGSGSNTAAILDDAAFYASLDEILTSQALHQDAGTLAPGASIGTTTVNDNYYVGDGLGIEDAIWEIEIDHATMTADLVDVNGILTLAADSFLDLRSLNDQPLARGDLFVFAEYDSLVGTFGGFRGPPLDGLSYAFYYDYLGSSQIAVQVVPEPVTLAGLALAVGAVAGYVRRRRRPAS